MNCCVLVFPLPPYIKEWRRGGPALYGAPKGGVLLLVGVGFPLSLVGVGEKEGGQREGRKAPHPIWIGLGGHALHLGLPLLSSTKAQ